MFFSYFDGFFLRIGDYKIPIFLACFAALATTVLQKIFICCDQFIEIQRVTEKFVGMSQLAKTVLRKKLNSLE